MSKPSRTAVISSLGATALPWEDSSPADPNKDTGSRDTSVELSKFKLAVRGMPDATQRIQALLGQLQPVQRPLAIYNYETPTMVSFSLVAVQPDRAALTE